MNIMLNCINLVPCNCTAKDDDKSFVAEGLEPFENLIFFKDSLAPGQKTGKSFKTSRVYCSRRNNLLFVSIICFKPSDNYSDFKPSSRTRFENNLVQTVKPQMSGNNLV